MRTVCCSLLAAAMLLGVLSWAFAVDPIVKSPGTITASGTGLAHVRIFHGTATFSGQGRLRVSAAGPGADYLRQLQSAGDTDRQKRQDQLGDLQAFQRHGHHQRAGCACLFDREKHHGQRPGRRPRTLHRRRHLHRPDAGERRGEWQLGGRTGAEITTAFWNSIRRVYGDYDFKTARKTKTAAPIWMTDRASSPEYHSRASKNFLSARLRRERR